ncbi:sarcosine oxidase subunit gamma [Pararhizobium mangrovi]|uniref:Sarcosine oxidase subunit gamma n=1 Tax=Pararhizobium mangrovi TaxID=2590452 RepID=A0A506U745_9HYPH|nr:sarcosine oxidase subunit gamma family protein [Pararhizobium mangrovi]TPW30232.1 sarcosine oxidase subunit gamma [Pararhizobium mangrovi]
MTFHAQKRPVAAAGAVTIEDLAPEARFSLRGDPADAGILGRTLGVDLPTAIGTRNEKDGRTALCLGPDEWVVLAGEAERDAILDAFAAIEADTPHALCDIGDREVSVRIVGPDAAALLAMGCPRDLSHLAPGRAVRTVFDGVSIVLWREAEEVYRLDAWRSSAPYVRELLETGVVELRAGL